MLVFTVLLALGIFAKAKKNPLGTDDDILWTGDDLLNRGGLLPLKEDCWQTYEYFPELKCNDGHDLYRYTGYSEVVSDYVSCGVCDCNAYNGTNGDLSPTNELYNLGPQCCPGWNGSQCDICTGVESCPAIDVDGNGTMEKAVQCTNMHLVPINTVEAAIGKKFSCACGGGEDSQSKVACPLQGTYKNMDGSSSGKSSTRFDWIFYGLGTASSPGSIKFLENVGARGNSWDGSNTGHYDYLYAVEWEGTLSDCVISEGKCMTVLGTDVGEQDCVNYECKKTQVQCPPEGAPVCPDGPDTCLMKPCEVLPSNSLGFDVSCLKSPNADGSFVCYFEQPGAYAPMSMTCNVGNCLYNTTNSSGISDYGATTRYVPKGLSSQMTILAAGVISLMVVAILIELVRRNSDKKFHGRVAHDKYRSISDQIQISGSTQVELGQVSSPFEADRSVTSASRQGATLTWHQVSLWVPTENSSNENGIGALVNENEKPILHRVNGSAHASGITALMGPSGAGKTSLLDCLASRKPMHRTEGKIYVDGILCLRENMREISGYVPQHDVLPSTMTVREHLLFHAALRCSPTMRGDYRHSHVASLISELGLQKCADSQIGGEFTRGLSGGEKRRVSVAEELVVEPGVLFLDEPTTGLDSATALDVCRTLAKISQRGTTVLLSIHQPREDIFALFDRVVVLCEGGHVVFEGAPQIIPTFLRRTLELNFCPDLPKVPAFLKALERNARDEPHDRAKIKCNPNPADLLLDVASSAVCQDLAIAVADGSFALRNHKEDRVTGDAWGACLDTTGDASIIAPCENVGNHNYELERRHSFASPFPPRHIASIWLQLKILSGRLVLTAARHPMLLCLQYFGCLFLAVCVGFIFYDLGDDLYGVQDRFGVLFFIPFCLILLGLSSLPVWRDEHILFTHEQANKRIYGYPAYFLSILLFDVVLVRTVPPTFFALISYEMIGLNDGCDDCLFYFVAVLVLTNIVASLIAMVVGAFHFSTSFSNLVGALLALLFALFAGFVVSKKSMADQGLPMYLLDPMSYAYEALLINQFGGQLTSEGADFYYTINGSLCAPGLPTVQVAGSTLLTTFGFSSDQADLQTDMSALWAGALGCALLAFAVLVGSAQAPEFRAWWRRSAPSLPFVDTFRAMAHNVSLTCSWSYRNTDRSLSTDKIALQDALIGNMEPEGHLGPDLNDESNFDDWDNDVDDCDGDEATDIEGRHEQTGSASMNDEMEASASSALFATEIAAQLAKPELISGHSPSPMVLSFHNVQLSVPPPQGSHKAAGVCCGSQEFDEDEKSLYGSPAKVVPFTCFWEGDSTSLGMLVGLPRDSNGSPHLPLVVEQIMFNSWAQLAGIKPGDGLVSVGGCKLTAVRDLQTLLESAPRPVRLDFLRRVDLTGTELEAKRRASSRPCPLAATEVSRLHRGLQPVLRGVSGTTVASFDSALQQRSSSSGGTPSPVGAVEEPAAPTALRPMVCGIMGPSGAGKTSLLDCLAGRKSLGTFTGEVRLNGCALHPREMRLLSGYVLQTDILPAMLTVRECLEFQAKLRVSEPAAVANVGAAANSREAQKMRVDATLKRLKLVRQQNTIVGNAYKRGLSGGEKRRLSVAIELLSEPAILFLDEPTTGQDSTTAVMLCRALRRIAHDGTTVVMSIHQPRIEIFQMLTQVVFLTRDGRVAYCGPSRHVKSYLDTELATYVPKATNEKDKDVSSSGTASNPADALLDVMADMEPQALVDAYAASKYATRQREVLEVLMSNNLKGAFTQVESKDGQEVAQVARLLAARGKRTAPWSAQFKHLSIRTLRNILRNPFPFVLHGITALVAAVALGLVFRDIHRLDKETAGVQDRFGIMFFLLVYLSLLSLTSLPLWREDQQLFVAERGSGIYTTSPYVLSTILLDVLPYRLLPPFVFTVVSYPMVGLNSMPGKQANFLVSLACCNLAVSGACMLVGVLTNTNASANAAGSLLMLTSILFCGFLLNTGDVSPAFRWLVWWSPGSYAYEALVYNEMDGLQDLFLTSTIAESELTAGPFTGDDLAHCFGFEDRVNSNQVVLIGMAFGYFCLVLLVMDVYIKEKR